MCGLRRRVDAELATELGAFALGFVFEPSSPRYVGEADWGPGWLQNLPSLRVAVYGFEPQIAPGLAFDAVQAVVWRQGGPRPRLSENCGSIAVIRLERDATWMEAVRGAPDAGMVLIDAHHATAFGGTGITVDWEVAASVCAGLKARAKGAPWFKVGLAGGLTPENVGKAIRIVRPDYVDVSSGVETAPGVKDEAKLREFFDAVRSVG